jgi:lyso-ornithine lipid O-acyltransferase
MGSFRALVRLTGFALLTLPLMPLQQIFVWLWPSVARWFPHYYHRLVCRILGIRIKRIGKFPVVGPALLIANHVSWIDIVAFSAVAPISFIAKRDVNGWPFFGQLARLQRTVFVDREKRSATGDSRNDMQRRFDAKDLLLLFPEGTSGPGNYVLPFKTAFFGAADYPGVLVYPISVAYGGYRNLPMTKRERPFFAWYGDMDLAPHLWAALKTGPIEITILCHPPTTLADHGNRKALARYAETTVAKGLAEALHGAAKTR